MKTILIPTDFSEKSKNAALYGLRMAEKMHADILLFHSYERFQPAGMSTPGSLDYQDYETVKNESLIQLQHVKSFLDMQAERGVFRPVISVHNELGPDFSTCADEIAKAKHVDLIVMGSRGNDTVSHIFNGSDAYAMLETATCPVLFIPENCRFNRLNTIIFANDFKKDYKEAIAFLTAVASMDDSHIILTHLGDYDNKVYSYLNLIKNELQFSNVSSRLLPLENVAEQLSIFAETADADLIAMIHHKGIQLTKIVDGSRSKKMLKHSGIPLLILPG